MNTRCLLTVGVLALFGAAGALSTWAQTDAEPEAREVEWPDTPAGCWAECYFEA